MMAPTVLLFGHSFVQRFRKYLSPQPLPTNTNFASFLQVNNTVSTLLVKGVSGLKVTDAATPNGPLLSLVVEHAPDIVILDIGTNDLDVDEPQHYTHLLVTYLQNLGDALVNLYGVRRVVFCQILTRDPDSNKPRADTSVHLINLSIFAVNLAMKLFANDQSSHFGYWVMKGLNHQAALAPDGLHLSDPGLRNYYYNIRKIITTSSNLLKYPHHFKK